MTPQIIIAAVIAATGFAGGFGLAWKMQAGTINAKEAQYAEQKLAQIQHNAAASIRRADNVIAAQNAATARSVAIRRDRDSAYAELDRLRDTLRTMPGAGDTTTACADRTDPARELFADCAAQLTDMAGKADRVNSDRQTLIDAWPK